MKQGGGFEHLHATQTVKVFRPTATVDDGVEVPGAMTTPMFSLVAAVWVDRDEVKRAMYGAEVEESIGLSSFDRSNLVQAKDVVEVTLAGVVKRFEVATANTDLVDTQQAAAVRRATARVA